MALQFTLGRLEGPWLYTELIVTFVLYRHFKEWYWTDGVYAFCNTSFFTSVSHPRHSDKNDLLSYLLDRTRIVFVIDCVCILLSTALQFALGGTRGPFYVCTNWTTMVWFVSLHHTLHFYLTIAVLQLDNRCHLVWVVKLRWKCRCINWTTLYLFYV